MPRHFAVAFAALILTATAQAAGTPPAAVNLARDALIIDTHIDAPTELLRQWKDIGLATDREFDYPKARQGGLDVAFMSIYTSPGEDAAGKARQTANMQIDAVEALSARHPDKFAVVSSPGDIGKLREGPTAELLDDLNLLDRVSFIYDLSNDEMAEQYARATICVTPSL
mgnify:CR=1 FL=1